MNTMKTNHEEFVAIFGAEVTELSAKVYSTKSPDELLTSYQGREKELLINLRKLAFKQQSDEEKKAMRLEIIGLVEELDLPKSPDELPATYDGRDDELLKNLKIIKIKKEEKAATIAEIHTLIDAMGLPKTADEMLVTYAGREGGLLKNLCKMKSKRDEDAVIKTKIVNLFEELDLPIKVDEMLAEYVGREEKLLTNLKKMKSNKEKANQSCITSKKNGRS